MSKVIEDNLNCKIYTPPMVAKLMIEQLDVDWNQSFKILEPACGNGNISVLLVETFLNNYDLSNSVDVVEKLENNFVFFDNDNAALKELNDNLNRLLTKFNIMEKVNWCIENINLLDLKHYTFNDITHSICNPPYIAARTLSSSDRDLFKKIFETCKNGNYDVYYAFIEYLCMSTSIKSVVITPNSFLVNKSANSLREVLNDKSCTIYDFPNQNLFENAQVKTAITVIDNNKSKKHYYKNCIFSNNECIVNVINNYTFINYKERLKTDVSINTYFNVNCGIATLNDAFYSIKQSEIISEDKTHIKFKKFDSIFSLNKQILKPTIRYKSGIVNGYVIYPYDNNMNERDMTQFSDYMHYHKLHKKDVKTFVYGRKQGLKYTNQKQLILPTIAKSLTVYECKDTLTMAGMYVTVKQEYLEYEELLLTWFKDNIDNICKDIKPLSKYMGDGYYTFSPTNIKTYNLNHNLV